MPSEPIMRPGHRPARVQRDWSLLVPLLALLAGLLLVLLDVWVLL